MKRCNLVHPRASRRRKSAVLQAVATTMASLFKRKSSKKLVTKANEPFKPDAEIVSTLEVEAMLTVRHTCA